jgi:hypothetical protein
MCRLGGGKHSANRGIGRSKGPAAVLKVGMGTECELSVTRADSRRVVHQGWLDGHQPAECDTEHVQRLGDDAQTI